MCRLELPRWVSPPMKSPLSSANVSLIERLIADPIVHFPSATVACFDPTTGDLPRRQLDEAKLTRFLRSLAEAGAPALLLGASTGHGHVRTHEELVRWFQAAAIDLPNCVRTALLRPEDGLAANRRLLEQLPGLGYPIVFFRPGNKHQAIANNSEAVDDAVFAELVPLVAAASDCGLAIGLYTIPDVSGVKLTPAVASRLLDSPGGSRIVAVKVTESVYESSTLAFLKHPRLQRLKVVQGWDPFLVRALQDGPRFDPQQRARCGVTSGPMSFAVFQYQHIFEAAARGDWSEAEQAQGAVTLLFQSMQDDPTKFADLQRAKYIMGLGEPLTSAVDLAKCQRVLETLRTLPREEDRRRLARSLNLMGDGPFAEELMTLSR